MRQEAPATTYAESVYRRLREEVLTGALRPGDRLTEVELAARMGTSQGPVREALARLRAEGLVTGFAHRGSFVSDISLERAREVYDARRSLERHALRLALPQMGDEEYRLLEGDVERMREAAARGDIVENLAADMRFHRRIFEWAGSELLLEFWDTIEARTRKFAATASPIVFRDPEPPVLSHYRLLERMRAGYGPALEEELDRHIDAIWAGWPEDGAP